MNNTDHHVKAKRLKNMATTLILWITKLQQGSEILNLDKEDQVRNFTDSKSQEMKTMFTVNTEASSMS